MTFAQHFAEALALGLVVAGDEDAVARGHGVQLVPDLRDLAAEALDRLDVQMVRRLDRRAGQGSDADARKPEKLLKDGRRSEQADRVVHAFEIVAALFVEFLGLDENDRGSGGEVVTQVAGQRRLRLRLVVCQATSSAGEFRRVHVPQAALRLRRELADGFDLVAEELDTERRLGVR